MECAGFRSEYGDNLHPKPYETRRSTPQRRDGLSGTVWEDGAPRQPAHLGISAQNAVQMFCLAGGSLTQVFPRAGARFEVEAWDAKIPQRYILHRVQYQRDVTQQRPRQTGGRQTASRF